MNVWLSIAEAAELEGISYRTACRWAKRNRYKTREITSDKQAGKKISQFSLSSLSKTAIRRHAAKNKPARQGSTVPAGTKRIPAKETAWYGSLPAAHREIVDTRRNLVTLFLENAPEKNEARLAVAEGFAESFGLSVRSLYRLLKAYETEGLYGLRSKNFGQTRTILTRDMQDFITNTIEDKPHLRPSHIHPGLNILHDTAVSEQTVARYMKKWKSENRQLYLFWCNPDGFKSKYQIAFGNASEKATHFLEYLEVDGSPADVICADGVRYNLTAGIDIFSRKPKVIVSPTSNSAAIAAMIRTVIVDWGIPVNIIRDNGKDYMSKRIDVALDALQVVTPPIPKFSPEKKPHVERFFGTMARSLLEGLSGFIGHNVADRKKIESRRTFAARFMKKGNTVSCGYMPDELAEIINNWIKYKYNHRIHTTIGMSPEQKTATSTAPVRKINDVRALDLLLSDVGEATVSKKGIRHKNGHFMAIEVMDYVGERVMVRRDTKNAGGLYVFSLDGIYLFTAIDEELFREQHSPAVLDQMRKTHRKKMVAATKAVKNLGLPKGDLILTELEHLKKQNNVAALIRQSPSNLPAMAEAAKAASGLPGFKQDKYKSLAERRKEDSKIPLIPVPQEEDIDNFWENVKIVNE